MISLSTIERLIKLITSLKPHDIFVIGFIAFLVLSLGTLTGYIPSPLLTMLEQHHEQQESIEKLVKVAELQLYLQRESCLQNAETPTDRARCDRQSIREIILNSETSVSTASTSQSLIP